ncbi:MAG: 6-bladed beta-propeller [Bacteroidetes bacterium]|jgi:hypothetical protein|nr:6-bladed beta-propeller [Bacteroidota bacterium]
MKILIHFFALLLFVSSCSKPAGDEEPSIDLFIEHIRSSTDELGIEQQSLIDSPDLYNPMFVLATSSSDYVLASDYADKSIKVIDRTGALLSETGGEGRGPGEYALINQLKRGYDRVIYVLDKRLNRIHSYNLDDETGELTLQETTPYKHEANNNISSLHVTEFGRFAVFSRLTNYETWENSFYLYSLDENYQPGDLLLELPGNDKIPVREDGMGKMDNFLGSLTLWDLDGEWFYYTTSKETDIYAYNLITGEQDTLTAINFEERTNSDAQREYLKTIYGRLIESSPSVETAINETETLPYFDSITAHDGKLILRLFDAGSDTGLLIHYNTDTGSVRHIKVPTYYTKISFTGNELFGTKTVENGERKIVNIALD